MPYYFLLNLLLLTASLVAQSPILGYWTGTVDFGGQSLTLVFDIKETEDGLAATMDSPDQGAFDIPVSEIDYADDTLKLGMPRLQLQYVATLDDDGNILTGAFSQRGFSIPLTMRRATPPPPPARPQEPSGELPYSNEEVTINAGPHSLAGTLTLPDEEAVAAVVLVTGSGPQDRDESLLGHRPFLVLADYLTRRGVAVLRYDDRGVGASTGDFGSATSADFAEDARAAVRYLQKEVSAKVPLGIIGHSEGGMIAPMVYAADSTLLDFAVLLAPPAIPIDSLLLLQSDRIGQLTGLPEDVRTRERAQNRRAYRYVREHPGLDSAALHTELATLVDAPQAEVLVQPWFRYFITYDPAPSLRGMRLPTLALFGSLDSQVTPEENVAAMLRLLPRHPGSRVVVLPGLNHLFQPATTGAPSEYAKIETTFDEEALGVVAGWINTIN